MKLSENVSIPAIEAYSYPGILKFYGNIMVSVIWWCKTDGWFIFPEVILKKNVFSFVWLKFTLKIVHIKWEKYWKGGEV